MEPENDRPPVNHPDLSGNPDVPVSDRPQTSHPEQNVWGDRNQVIGSVSGGNVFGNVENLNQYIQQAPPRFLSKHQLPPDIADFTGRTKEINEILATLRQTKSQAVAISGMAGSGKSALAIRVAHELKAKLDEVQLYANLRGAEDHQALEPATVLVGWLRALGLDDASIPAELEGRVNAYRSLLHGRRAIVLLDNAQNENQIRPLLPGHDTCAVLITSRKTLVSLPGANVLELPMLPEDEALSLLRTLIGATRIDAEPEPATRILTLCGRLPLAIRMAAGTLSKPSQKQKPLATYAQQLQDEKQRLPQLRLAHFEENLDVRTSFNLSYRELSDNLADLFCWLGLLDAPDFGVAVAAVLIEADEAVAQEGIDALIDAQLLEIVSEKRYRFHDLICLFAREQLEKIKPAEEQRQVKRRVVQYFLKWSGFMSRCLRPKHRRKFAEARVREDPTLLIAHVEQDLEQEALTWFEQERLTLPTLVQWSMEAQAWVDLRSLSRNSDLFLNQCSYWLDAEQIYQQTLHATRQLGDRYGEGTTLMRLGNVYKSQGKWEEAINLHQQSLQISRQLGDRYGEGATLSNLGRFYRFQGKWEEAINLHQQSLQIKRQLGDRSGEGVTLNNLGGVYDSQGKWKEAIDLFQQSLQISRQLGDRSGEGTNLRGLGNVYQSQGKWEKAIDLYQQNLQIKRQLGDRSGEGQCLNNLGNVYKSQGKWEEAIDLFQQSLLISCQLGDHPGEGLTLMNLGMLHQKRGNFVRAAEYWQEAIEKLPSESPEYRQVYAILHPNKQTILTALGVLLLGIIALIFIVSNLLAGRWFVALAILLISVMAFLILKALKNRY